jgi:hypothetical protein
MAKLFGCYFCVAEMERFKLADAHIALVRVARDVIGREHEMTHGGPRRPAGLSAAAPAAKKRRARLRPRGEGAGHGR